MSNYKTLETIRTATNEILIHASDEGRVVTVEANGEFFPLGLVKRPNEAFSTLVSASAWDGGGVPESVELLDPKANNFAYKVEARCFGSEAEAEAARRLHVQLTVAELVWFADSDERMSDAVYEFLRRLLTAGQGLGVEMLSAAALNPGCSGLVAYVNGPLWRAQAIGIGLDQAGELQFTECGEQSAPRDLSRLCRLVAGRTLETWTVEFDAEHGFRAIEGETTDGILDDLVDAETAAALVVALEEACPKVNGTWEYSDPRIDVCPQHEKVARYMRRYLGSECTCCR